MKNKKVMTARLIITVCIFILIGVVIYHYRMAYRMAYRMQYVNKLETFANGDICTLTLDNIDPMYVKNYEALNGRQIRWFNKLTNGFCVGATLKVKINPQPTDNTNNTYGSGSNQLNTKQTATIINSNGARAPSSAVIPIDPWGLPNYFCV